MKHMKLTFVNVGYGEAILIECPDPRCADGTFVMVVDGGGAEPEEFLDGTSGRLLFADHLVKSGLRHIDLMVSSHVHEDHLCGLVPAARAVPVGAYWQTMEMASVGAHPLDLSLARTPSHRKFLSALNDHQALLALLAEAGSSVSAMTAGMSGELCDGLRYTVLAPSALRREDLEERLRTLYAQEDEETFMRLLTALDGQMNNYSLMLLLDYHGTRILLPGDTNCLGYGDVDPETVRADIFKVGHHGQKDGADQALLDMVQPKAVVCCASSDRRYNSAHPELMAMIANGGAGLWFSDAPVVAGQEIPSHHALTFTIGEDGQFTAAYH